MKQLIRRLSRVADSSQYCLLRSDPEPDPRPSPARSESLSSSFRQKMRRRVAAEVPSGHVPVYVGEEEEMERFVVSAELVNHPVFVELLERYSVTEYGYEQQGVLRIPCHVILFERVIHALRLGHSRDLRELLGPAADCSSSFAAVVSA